MAIPLEIQVSICGYLYTPVDKDLSVSGVIKMSRKGIEPSGLVSSTVYWMLGYTELMWCGNSFLYDFTVSQMYHSHIFSKILDGFSAVLMTLHSKFPY